jgi:transposase InsO family protein
MARTRSGNYVLASRTKPGGRSWHSGPIEGGVHLESFLEFCSERGIKHHLTTPYSPQQNGMVEHCNQSVLAMARSMMKAKAVPARLWGEAVMTAVFLLNRALLRSLVGRMPYEAWHGEKSVVHFLRVFDCVAHVKVTKSNAGKLDDQSTRMVMIRYEAGLKAYRVYDPVANRVHVTRDTVFEEGAAWD